jgi:tetratricopeptide (TPR) repeat protein
MYLPLAAVLALVIAGAHWVVRAVARQPAAAASGVGLVTAILVVFSAASTQARNRDYWSVEAMVATIVEGRPTNAHAQLAHAVHAIRARQFAEAERGLRYALDLPLPYGQDEAPLRAQMHMYLGSALSAQGKIAEGTPHLERALALDPNLTETYGLLGENYLGQGRAADAVHAFERALEKMPDVPPLFSRAAWVLATSSHAEVRDGARAVRYAERAVTLTGGRDANALATLAAAYAETGQFDRAISAVNQAISVASSQGQSGLLTDLRRYLALFSEHRAVRSGTW